VTVGATRQRTVYTGDQYLESLRDGREVWIDGERVADVTAHPAFRSAARSVARLYDAMHDPEDSQVLLGVDNRGIETHRFFMPSYTTEDLQPRADQPAGRPQPAGPRGGGCLRPRGARAR
jgi:paerucumarin biosynthesis protein PvcC